MSDTSTAETLYCYHCSTQHPKTAMRQILTKTGRRWRCVKSIEATRQGRASREAFGRQTTAINKASTDTKNSRLANPEHNYHY